MAAIYPCPLTLVVRKPRPKEGQRRLEYQSWSALELALQPSDTHEMSYYQPPKLKITFLKHSMWLYCLCVPEGSIYLKNVPIRSVIPPCHFYSPQSPERYVRGVRRRVQERCERASTHHVHRTLPVRPQNGLDLRDRPLALLALNIFRGMTFLRLGKAAQDLSQVDRVSRKSSSLRVRAIWIGNPLWELSGNPTVSQSSVPESDKPQLCYPSTAGLSTYPMAGIV